MKALLFSYAGRLNRAAFWKGNLLLLAMWIGVWASCGLLVLLFPANTDTSAKLFLAIALGIAIFGLCIGSFVGLIWASVCLGIKRYHDHDKPGIWVCIQFVPVIGGVWYFVEAFCLDGTHGPNVFGPDPLGRVPPVTSIPPGAANWPGPAHGPGLPPHQTVYVARPSSGRPGWVLPLMFALLVPPALALTAGLVMTARSAIWLNRAIHVDGTVSSLQAGEKNDKGRMQYYPVVEATTPEGRAIQATGGWSTYPPAEIGSKMVIAYPPGRPEDAKVDDFFDFWLVPLLLDLSALVVFGWLFVILIVKLVWKRHPRPSPPSALSTFA